MNVLDEWSSLKRIVVGNLALCQCQALVVSLLVSIVAIGFNWVPKGDLNILDTLLLCSSSMLTASLASAVLGLIMVVVVVVRLIFYFKYRYFSIDRFCMFLKLGYFAKICFIVHVESLPFY